MVDIKFYVDSYSKVVLADLEIASAVFEKNVEIIL